MSIAQQLWSFTAEHPPTLVQLEAIAAYMTEQLAVYVEQAVTCFHEHLVEGSALAYSVRPASGVGGRLAVQWEAVVLYDVRRTGPPSIDVEMFLFAFGRRVKSAGGDYINLRGELGREGQGVRFEASWSSDEFGEWEYITAPRVELYEQMRRTYG
jgi:hypothetical protein